MRTALSAVIAIVLTTAFFGFAYPLVMTGVAQVAFKHQANGSLITRNGTVVGSKLAAQEFTGTRYFHERPSGTSPAYNAGATTFANLGPTNPDLAKNVKSAAQAILTLTPKPGFKAGADPTPPRSARAAPGCCATPALGSTSPRSSATPRRAPPRRRAVSPGWTARAP